MRRYESYKASGLEWLGDIPADWTLKKSKFLWREREDRSLLGDEELLSVSQYVGIVPRADESRSESLEDYKKCQPDDLVINIMLAWMGGLGVSNHSGIVSPAYCVYRQLENHNPQYLGYLYRTTQYLAEFARRSKGVVPSRWRMYTEDFGQVLTVLPPRAEQDRIVNFLDQKNSEIDAAIAKKERLIELLQEQKSILISQAVTRGLIPNVSTWDSGAKWFGKVPTHWSVLPLRRVSRFVRTGRTPPSSSKFSGFEDGNIPWFTPGDFQEDCCFEGASRLVNQRAIDHGHVDLYPERSLYFIGIGATLGKVCFSAQKASCNQQINVIGLTDEHDPLFFAFQLNSARRAIFRLAEYTTMPILNQSGTKAILVAIPPYLEQKEITAHIRLVSDHFRKIKMAQEDEIKSLRELRAVLVSDVVSGKIRV